MLLRPWDAISGTMSSNTSPCHVSEIFINSDDAITLFTLIASVKWALRMPTRFAISKPTYHYTSICEEKVLDFLSLQFRFDLGGGDEDLNLDMTLEEAEFLFMASDDIKAKAERGELLELTSWMRDFEDRKNLLISQTYDSVDKVLQSADTLEDEIVEDLLDESDDLQSLRKSGGTQTLLSDLSGVSSDSRSFENLITVEGFVSKNPRAEDVASKLDTLRQLMTVRGEAMRIKMELQTVLIEKETEDNLSRSDYLATVDETQKLLGAGSGETVGETQTLMG